MKVYDRTSMQLLETIRGGSKDIGKISTSVAVAWETDSASKLWFSSNFDKTLKLNSLTL